MQSALNDVSPEFAALLVIEDSENPPAFPSMCLQLTRDLSYLQDGDVIRIGFDGAVSVLYRRAAAFNALLTTERCNNFCIMCSQPPRAVDDGFLVDELMQAVPMFDRSAKEICITGGEPTLLRDRLAELVLALKSWLPNTSVHILSNGRAFEAIENAMMIASVRHPDLMVGIPIYSAVAAEHDFVVQAQGAYDETIRGILNLKRCGVRVEVRTVIHRHTYHALPSLAQFISRNLQFVDHVALMGFESAGFGKSNFDELWIDPLDYQSELQQAVEVLMWAGSPTSIYNHQLCVLPERLRHVAVRSISDWKEEYRPECGGCTQRGLCGGFFATGSGRVSRGIRAIREPQHN